LSHIGQLTTELRRLYGCVDRLSVITAAATLLTSYTHVGNPAVYGY